MGDYILEMKDITKEFPGVKALDRVNFQVRKGEIHCLVGENGAGKSTLMKVLSGVYPYGTYSGQIILNGAEQHFTNIADSEKAGVAIIYQELALIPELTVYENIYFGHEIMNGKTVDWNKTIIDAREILEKVGCGANPVAKVKDFGVGTRQLIEIAKALSKDIKLLILDEPTAALTEADSAHLLDLLRKLKTQGVTCIMISHKLKEISEIADSITILRDGKTICSMDATKQKVPENVIIRHMVGREIDNVYPPKEQRTIGEVSFEVKDWSAYDPAAGREILHHVGLNVRKGEIVGIAGLMGAGRTEFALSVFGNPRGYKVSGDMFINGEKVSYHHPAKAIRGGLAYMTEDRKANGLILIQDIKQNIVMSNLKKICRKGIINENEEVISANGYMKSINIKAPSVDQVVGNLSGGNQQKVSLSKCLFIDPHTLILDEPTRGIDVGAKYEIYTIMNRLVANGMSILMISSELPEILGMSDRIYVMSEGRITGELPTGEATEEKIMTMATVS
ncbi:sugar ABC transporter ATP-binding protein [Caproiciproducens sp. NJN-50]|uniref:sugar ABC transporter ATP-binding protein n=1 Tax=Acutalibacteraceae TaxID=3082771 RepID=UPI000FFDFCC8|nr:MULTISPECIES: sugar ABC transporter ATP-binding protein [Acutalibacteraceae]QAT48424.1 sugar ABC transporter ATP-binding protein [Caproiciproducens sp. NJN-50]